MLTSVARVAARGGYPALSVQWGARVGRLWAVLWIAGFSMAGPGARGAGAQDVVVDRERTAAVELPGRYLPVTLSEALEAARAAGPLVQASAARAEAARHQERAVSSASWPSLGAEAGALVTDDPVAVFGARLRQGRFGESDFGLDRLNDPAALDDWNAALVLGWTPVDFARSAGVRGARAATEAAEHSAEWTVCSAEFEAEMRYLDAVAAGLLLGAANAAVEAADANLTIIQRRYQEGILTLADVLQAESAVEAARARAISVERMVADARGRLGLAMGWTTDVPMPVGDDWDGDVARSCGAAPRADLTASEAALRSSRALADEAGGARLPRVDGFARVEGHSAAPLGNGAASWTLGVRVTLPLFTGFGLEARRDAALAVAEAEAEAHEDRLHEAATALAEAGREVSVSARAAEAAESASRAAEEAARLTRMRFEQGLVTTAELLAVEARAAELASASVQARLTHRRAQARAAFLDDSRLQAASNPGGIER